MAGKIIGVQNLTIAKMLTDDINGATYDTPVALTKKLMKIAISFANSSANLEADDQIVDRVQSYGEIKVGIDVTDLTESEKALILGNTIAQGVRTRNKNDIAPFFSVMFKSKKNDNTYKYVKILKVQFSEPNADYESGGSSTKFQTPKLEGAGIQRMYDGNDMRTADESEATYVSSIGTNWFNSGDISVDVTAPTLTSTTPANNATAIAVGSTIQWVFSEGILPTTVIGSNFFVAKDSDGSVVAGNLTQSADKTTITFTPSANLTAATIYRFVATTGVKDLSGNALAGVQMRKFTTA